MYFIIITRTEILMQRHRFLFFKTLVSQCKICFEINYFKVNFFYIFWQN